ncbi:class F sortase [Nocardioides sp. SOB44]|uniref:Class F sortase n=1 Tax=Nocardioides cremeus TaxID=3058044 RepID=A0ABT8TQK1_9ACTN|nr:class F sortase [Nocardioides cremeus]MDO3396237.1 class F sortase [Nocardioides cremeus]
MPLLPLDRHPRPVVVAAVAGFVLVVVLSAIVATRSGDEAPRAETPAGTADTAETGAAGSDDAAAAGVDTIEEATYAERAAGDPDRLRIPALGVDAPVLAVEAPGRVLVPPRDPQRLGWWSQGARPGAATGSALVVGHTVHSGGGALDDLETLAAGDRMTVRAAGGDLAYEVRSVRVYDKGRIARDAGRIFSQEVDGRLVVLTCEDWDGQGYRSNVVVVAEPVGAGA